MQLNRRLSILLNKYSIMFILIQDEVLADNSIITH
jgi:hypothetical protein